MDAAARVCQHLGMREHPLRQQLELALAAAQQPNAQATMLRLDADDARLQLEHVLGHPEGAALPLRGQRVSVKDLFDVAGQVTAAGSVLLGEARVPVKPAPHDATVVSRRRQAGAVLIVLHAVLQVSCVRMAQG